MKTTFRILLCALALFFALAGCAGQQPMPGTGSGPEDAETETGGSEAAPSGPVSIGEEYRDFTATLADGSSFTLSEQEGKVILLNFWATWCGPCVGEMPAFPRLIEDYGDQLSLIAVNCGEDADTVRGFLDQNGYTFPVALDEEYTVSALYPTDGIPYTVVIAQNGRIVATQLGADTADKMYEHYAALIDGMLE